MKEAERAMIMAVNDTGLTRVTKTVLLNMFPEVSGFEKYTPKNIETGKGCNKGR